MFVVNGFTIMSFQVASVSSAFISAAQTEGYDVAIARATTLMDQYAAAGLSDSKMFAATKVARDFLSQMQDAERDYDAEFAAACDDRMARYGY